ncbi:MAG: N-acetylmuramoyl-L-alanine amidase [Lachnospirales bacterium]
MKIFLDPGHGGTDSGGISPYIDNFYEKNATLDICLRLERILLDRGYEVEMSRRIDTTVSLNERINKANNWGADYYVSVHVNSFTNPNANGVETYYYPTSENGEVLASEIQSQLVLETTLEDRGVKPRDLAVLRRTTMPAALAEIGFISNPLEGELLHQEHFRQLCAEAIADGITQTIIVLG